MLTEEQIKNLKKGDKLLAEVQFHSFASYYSDLICLAPLTVAQGDVVKADSCYHLSCLSLPPAKPKHDPNRLFKKGDKVRLHHVHGRPATHSGYMQALPLKNDKNEDVIYEVVLEEEAEEGNGILLTSEYLNRFVVVHVSHIELVTPVEELEPYSVQTCQYGYCVSKGARVLATYNDDNHPHAFEAAEDECARLNAEYRKEQP